MVEELARTLIESLTSEPNAAENKEQLRKLLAQLRQRHPEIFSGVSSNEISKRDEDGRPEIEQLILSLSVVGAVITPVGYFLTPLPLDEHRFHTVGGGESCRPHNSIRRFGPEYTHSGSAGSIGGERRP